MTLTTTSGKWREGKFSEAAGKVFFFAGFGDSGIEAGVVEISVFSGFSTREAATGTSIDVCAEFVLVCFSPGNTFFRMY